MYIKLTASISNAISLALTCLSFIKHFSYWFSCKQESQWDTYITTRGCLQGLFSTVFRISGASSNERDTWVFILKKRIQTLKTCSYSQHWWQGWCINSDPFIWSRIPVNWCFWNASSQCVPCFSNSLVLGQEEELSNFVITFWSDVKESSVGSGPLGPLICWVTEQLSQS